jgi:DNA repair protein RadC
VSDRNVEEALAALLGSRRKARTLLGATSLRHLAEAPPEELETWLPPKTARRFHAAIRLARFALAPERSETLDSPYAAFAHFHPYLALRETERVVVAALDGRFRVLATEVVAEGAPDAVQVRPADVFTAAVRHRATAIVAAHNHPSGEMTPSVEDYALTMRLTELGKALGIRVLDHLVVVGDGFWSVLCGDRGTSAEAAERDAPEY